MRDRAHLFNIVILMIGCTSSNSKMKTEPKTTSLNDTISFQTANRIDKWVFRNNLPISYQEFGDSSTGLRIYKRTNFYWKDTTLIYGRDSEIYYQSNSFPPTIRIENFYKNRYEEKLFNDKYDLVVRLVNIEELLYYLPNRVDSGNVTIYSYSKKAKQYQPDIIQNNVFFGNLNLMNDIQVVIENKIVKYIRYKIYNFSSKNMDEHKIQFNYTSDNIVSSIVNYGSNDTFTFAKRL